MSATSPTTEGSLADQIARHAEILEQAGRSPLYVELMCGAAADAAAGGVVAEILGPGPAPPGSVPALRLMAALHYLVLIGRAPTLAEHYPNVGGVRGVEGAWLAAERAIEINYDELAPRAQRTVQTNEPGRATVLYGALLWVAEHFRLPVRLLEIGASAGLNLLADRYAYRLQGQTLGDTRSRVQFRQPWKGRPVEDLDQAERRLNIQDRAGCDLNPLRASDPEARSTLLSYLWPDEPKRWGQANAALAIAAADLPPLAPATAASWLESRLKRPTSRKAVVVWQSVVDQYLDAQERRRVAATLTAAGSAAGQATPMVWLRMEPRTQAMNGFQLNATIWPGGKTRTLATCNAHGPPVAWGAGT